MTNKEKIERLEKRLEDRAIKLPNPYSVFSDMQCKRMVSRLKNLEDKIRRGEK